MLRTLESAHLPPPILPIRSTDSVEPEPLKPKFSTPVQSPARSKLQGNTTARTPKAGALERWCLVRVSPKGGVGRGACFLVLGGPSLGGLGGGEKWLARVRE